MKKKYIEQIKHEVVVKPEELHNLLWLVKNTEDQDGKRVIYMAFIKGLIRKAKGK